MNESTKQKQNKSSNAMDSSKAQLADKLKTATHVLVTVGRNPSVDQLSALIGLTLLLNKDGKHAAAVFSGEVPSTLEFLQPDATIEKTTDSLRDFIIALDKSKADKLRYKVEDDVVRIFITPYRTSITQEDLEFSQGDFNVDVVIALGVTEQEDLDEAIVSHGRILHDATVATINLTSQGDLGSIHWQEPQASSLSEMMTELARLLGNDLIDNQIATAFLTGIVAETDRFSNEKTTAQTMNASATLMAAGANQQLVATQLLQNLTGPVPATEGTTDQAADSPETLPLDNDEVQESLPEEPKEQDGSLEISHTEPEPLPVVADDVSSDGVPEQVVELDTNDIPEPALLPEVTDQPPAGPPSSDESTNLPELPSLPELPELPPIEQANSDAGTPQIATDTAMPLNDAFQAPDRVTGGSRLITEAPTMGGQLTANSQPEALDPSTDPLGLPDRDESTMLSRDSPASTSPTGQSVSPPESTITGLTPPPPAWVPPSDNPLDLPSAHQPVVSDEPNPPIEQTLTDLEAAVQSSEAVPASETPESLDAARDEVQRALNSDVSQPLPPVEALNAQPLLENLNSQPPLPSLETTPQPTFSEVTPTAMPPAPAMPDSTQQIPSLPLPSSPAPSATPFDPATFGITTAPGASIPGMPPTADPAASPQVIDPTAPPPVPPPIPFNFGNSGNPPQ